MARIFEDDQKSLPINTLYQKRQKCIFVNNNNNCYYNADGSNKARNKFGYYKVIERIVTRKPKNNRNILHDNDHHGNNENDKNCAFTDGRWCDDGDSGGEIETCLEEFVVTRKNSSKTKKLTNNAESKNNDDEKIILFRRVSIRSNSDNNSSGNDEANNGSSGDDNIHVSFNLPLSSKSSSSKSQEEQQKDTMCWTTFNDRPNHMLLCVLINTSTLGIYDAYPRSNDSKNNNNINISDSNNNIDNNFHVGSGEGYQITLPFEAKSIYSLQSSAATTTDNNRRSYGLLIQRLDTIDDQIMLYQQQQNNIAAEMQQHKNNAYGGDFVLKDPPKPIRVSTATTTNNKRDNVSPMISPTNAGTSTAPQPQPTPSNIAGTALPTNSLPPPLLPPFGNTIPSLFTLCHPLEEVLPVALQFQPSSVPSSSPGDSRTYTKRQEQLQQALLFSDVYEQVIYVGMTQWVDVVNNETSKKKQRRRRVMKEYQQPIAVTYHQQLKRHAVWIIENTKTTIVDSNSRQLSSSSLSTPKVNASSTFTTKATTTPLSSPLWQETSIKATTTVKTKTTTMKQTRFNFDNVDTMPFDGVDGPEDLLQHDVSTTIVSSSHQQPATTYSRNEALADALGVATTASSSHQRTNNDGGGTAGGSDNSMIRSVTRSNKTNRNTKSINNRNTTSSNRHHHHHHSTTPPFAPVTAPTEGAVGGGGLHGNSIMMDISSPISPGAQNEQKQHVASEIYDNSNPTTIISPFTNLQPNFGLSLIWSEEEDCEEDQQQQDTTYVTKNRQQAATNIFLASNHCGSGKLLLCLQCPSISLLAEGDKDNKSNMKLDGNNDDASSSINTLSNLQCYSINVVTNTENDDDAKKNNNNNKEKQYLQNTSSNNKFSFSMTHLQTIPCISAQPIQSIPQSDNFHPHSTTRNSIRTKSCTDILVLQPIRKQDEIFDSSSSSSSVGNTVVALYRANMKLVNFSFLDNNNHEYNIVDMNNPVKDRIDFICTTVNSNKTNNKNGSIRQKLSQGQVVVLRGSIPLVIPSTPLAEKVLSVVESGLVSSPSSSSLESEDVRRRQLFENADLALKIRVDCIRLYNELSNMMNNNRSSLLVEDPSWAAISTLLSFLMENHLYRMTAGTKTSLLFNSKKSEDRHSSSSAWELLLASEFNYDYIKDNGSSLFLSFEDNDTGGMTRDRQTQAITNAKPNDQFFDILSSMTSYANSCLINRHHEPQTSQGGSNSSSTESVICNIFDSLHLLYEDLKLSKTSSTPQNLRAVGSLLIRTCVCSDRLSKMYSSNMVNGDSMMADFLDYYRRDLGFDLVDSIEKSIIVPKTEFNAQLQRDPRRLVTSFKRPPCFFSWADETMQGKRSTGITSNYSGGNVYTSEELNASCNTTISLCRILSLLFKTDRNASQTQQSIDQEVVLALIDEGITDPIELRDEFPTGIALPLMETLRRCREDPQTTARLNWPSAAWKLIGRPDLGRQFRLSRSGEGRPRKESRMANMYGTGSMDRNSFFDRDRDGIVPLELSSSMLFPDDNRIREVGRLLRSSRPTFLRVERAVETSDHDYERLKQEKLLILSRRVLALPLGRGMLTFGTLEPVAAEPLPLPELCLAGRISPTNATLALDVSNCPSDMKVWPDFHNGVAAGLRIADASDSSEGAIRQITRTWIVYNRPPPAEQQTSQNNNNGSSNESNTNQADHVHGGLLMALGLRGHLSALSMTDIYDYLTQGSVTTTVGILLGMAANKLGSCDPSVSKMLCLHIPSLLPPSFAAIDVASPAQAAAVAGIGLLYQKSSHRLMTEFLLTEMGKRPISDTSTCDREAYTLSCGLALGMVNLCQGDKDAGGMGGGSAGLADLHIEERLYRYIVGGVDDMELRRRREASDRATNSNGVNSGEPERCSRIYEGDTINTDVTAPGATLALGLMYMKSGNNAIANSLALPDTHFLLEYVRPDFLLLRVVARCLILWNDVKPSSGWIDDQIPEVVTKSFRRMRLIAEDRAGLGPADDSTEYPGEKKTESLEIDVDRQALRQIHAHVVAGACFGIGLRFAGTGDKGAAAAIGQRVMDFLTMRDENDPVSMALRPEQPILEMCLACSAISLAIVMAGTGDLETLRLFKMLRWRCDDNVKYGSHMAYSSAIGLLFLGGGTCTLGRSPEDIAALVMAFFPRFPSSTSDNQYHLQALRQCYALAVKYRELNAVDVDTLEKVFVPVEIQMKTQMGNIQKMAPCVILNTNDTPARIRVVSERYYPLTMDIDNVSEFSSLFVKKRSGVLGHFQDPNDQRSLLVQAGSSSGGHSSLELIRSFTRDPRILAYAQYLCENNDYSTGVVGKTANGQLRQNLILPKKGRPGTYEMSDFCTSVLRECLTGDKGEALPLYLALRDSVESMSNNQSSVSAIIETAWNIRLLRTYYEYHYSLVGVEGDVSADRGRLLSHEFLSFLCEIMDTFIFVRVGITESSLRSYIESGGDWEAGGNSRGAFGSFLTWCNIPFPSREIANAATFQDDGMILE